MNLQTQRFSNYVAIQNMLFSYAPPQTSNITYLPLLRLYNCIATHSSLPIHLFIYENDFHSYTSAINIVNIFSHLFSKPHLSYKHFLFPNMKSAQKKSKKSLRGFRFRHLFLKKLGLFMRFWRASFERRAALRKGLRLLPREPYIGIFTKYTYHPRFLNYSRLFEQNKLRLTTPLIRVHPYRFDLQEPTPYRFRFNNRRFIKSKVNPKRATFLRILLTLTKKIKIISLKKRYYSATRRFIRGSLDRKSLKKRKYYLIPKQTAFLNNYPAPSYRLYKASKSILLKKASHLYARSLRKLSTRLFHPSTTAKPLRWSWRSRTLPKRTIRCITTFLNPSPKRLTRFCLQTLLYKSFSRARIKRRFYKRGKLRRVRLTLRGKFVNIRSLSFRRYYFTLRRLRRRRKFGKKSRPRGIFYFRVKLLRKAVRSVTRSSLKYKRPLYFKRVSTNKHHLTPIYIEKHLKGGLGSEYLSIISRNWLGSQTTRVYLKAKVEAKLKAKAQAKAQAKAKAKAKAKKRRGRGKVEVKVVEELTQICKFNHPLLAGHFLSKSFNIFEWLKPSSTLEYRYVNKKFLRKIFSRRVRWYARTLEWVARLRYLEAVKRFKRRSVGTTRVRTRRVVSPHHLNRPRGLNFTLYRAHQNKRNNLKPLLLNPNNPNNLKYNNCTGSILEGSWCKQYTALSNSTLYFRLRRHVNKGLKVWRYRKATTLAMYRLPRQRQGLADRLVLRHISNKPLWNSWGAKVVRGDDGQKIFSRRITHYQPSYSNLSRKLVLNYTSNLFLSTFNNSPFRPILLRRTLPTAHYIFLRSKYKAPFIFSNFGFLFLYCGSLETRFIFNKTRIKSRINKYRLSFFYKNDIKRFYLRRPGKLKLMNMFLRAPLAYKKARYSFTAFKSENSNLTSNFRLERGSNLTNQYIKPSSFPSEMNHKFNLRRPEYHLPEPHIKRIKFKPGYSRIWRKAREAINYSLNLHFRYQKALTRYLNRLQRVRRSTVYRMKDLSLMRVVLNAKLVLDVPSSILILQNDLVFVNGDCTSNPNLYMFVGDFIQVMISWKYYVVYRWLSNWNLHHNLRITKLNRHRNNKSKHDLSKQKAYHFPDWIFTIGFKKFDIPKYFEVDYFTLSAFIIYEPLSVSDFNPLNILESRSDIYNMYNWKYIN